MKIKRFLLAFELFLIIHETASFSNNSVHAHQKRMVGDPYRYFSSCINTCLFDDWVTNKVLSKQVACSSQQLCYGKHNGEKALFAVCYNTNTLIPEFTGNIVENGGTSGEQNMIYPPELQEKEKWKYDKRLEEDKIPVALDTDYDPSVQAGKFDNYNNLAGQYLGRGHLSPRGDFSDNFGERSFTFITTNCAPQWQPFNMENWAAVERVVRDYADQNTRTLYVFTGTGGKAKYNGGDIKLKNVLTPKYFWKAVCDPLAKQSVVFVAENKPGEINTVDKDPGCDGIKQTRKFGVVYCYGLEGAAANPDYKDFKLPPFDPLLCKTNARGSFLDAYLRRKNKKGLE